MINYFKSGVWNVICDVCGKKCKSDEVQKRWDGLVVCKSDYETRQPLDFLRVRADQVPPPFIRDEPADTFINPYMCDLDGKTSIPSRAVPGCMIPAVITPINKF